MERYVSVEKLKDALYEKEWQIIPPLKEVEEIIDVVASDHAEWAHLKGDRDIWICTACDNDIITDGETPDYKFCPYCGIPIKVRSDDKQ